MNQGILLLNPNWAFLDNLGQIAAGGSIIFTDANNPTVPKAVYKDLALTIPWQDPIPLDASGKQVDDDGHWNPIYGSDNAYSVIVKDASGNTLIGPVAPFPIYTQGGGAAGNGVENFVLNPQFRLWWAQVLTSPLPVSIEPLCPGNWGFVKNNTSATDAITFPAFAVGQEDVPVNPRFYFQYNCNGAGTSEAEKYLYWLTSDVTTFAAETISIQFWAKSTLVSPLNLSFLQSFGAGGSPDVLTPINTVVLTTEWQLYQMQFAVPSLSGKSIGTGGDDYLEVQFNFPLNMNANIALVNVDIRTGIIYESIIEQSVEQTENDCSESVIQQPNGVGPNGLAANNPPGYLLAINSDSTNLIPINPESIGIPTGIVVPFRGGLANIPAGWIPEMVGTIGNGASGGTIRANADVQTLYVYYWTNYPSIKSTVSGGTTGTALGDFNANKTMALDDLVSRTNAPFGQNPNISGATNFTVGQPYGEQDHILTVNELAPHTHTVNSRSNAAQSGGDDTHYFQGSDTGSSTNSAGGGVGHNTYQPTIFSVMIAKL